MKKIISIVGARPNFMKVAPIHKAFQKHTDKIIHKICHTGQHYDEKMSKVFFDELGLPKPDYYLGVQGGSHAIQTANIMVEFEKVVLEEKPDLVLVVGDVNSTIACSLVASKLHIKVAHVEAGLRSFDNEMPEEINRILTDRISDYLFVTEKSGLENLDTEGVSKKKIFFTGNVMIDSLVNQLPKIDESKILSELNVKEEDFALVTLHRPSNVDTEDSLKTITDFLSRLSQKIKIVFPVHPRTKNNLSKYNLLQNLNGNIIMTDPIGYIDFQALMKNSKVVVTDSGGLQEESTFLGVQCITVRTTTERPVTMDVGTNQLVGVDFEKALVKSEEVINGYKKAGTVPELWDGKAAERITQILVDKLNK
ncbi:MAG: non-hydrolyzing UDP-N-acetylglucosamine 2-epimerase [Rhodothermaceae bacterium]